MFLRLFAFWVMMKWWRGTGAIVGFSSEPLLPITRARSYRSAMTGSTSPPVFVLSDRKFLIETGRKRKRGGAGRPNR
jgi:hypothetical protein